MRALLSRFKGKHDGFYQAEENDALIARSMDIFDGVLPLASKNLRCGLLSVLLRSWQAVLPSLQHSSSYCNPHSSLIYFLGLRLFLKGMRVWLEFRVC